MKAWLLLLVFIYPVTGISQLGKHYHSLSDRNSHQLNTEPSLRITDAGKDYDVKYSRLHLCINPDSPGVYVRGNVSTYFKTLQNNFSTVKFVFASNLIVNSITVHYQGGPIPDAWGTVYIKALHSGYNYIYTLSEPYSANSCWPCKTEVSDKADSLDLIISTPLILKQEVSLLSNNDLSS